MFTILCPSSFTKDSEIKSLCDEYIKRIAVGVTLTECSPKIKQNDSDAIVKQKQGEAILKSMESMPSNTVFIALDEHGKDIDSPQFAAKIADYQNQGYSAFCFIIGGAFGLSADVLAKVDLKLSFGKMVWPHRLVGVMVLEQIYRALSINAGHPYHKA